MPEPCAAASAAGWALPGPAGPLRNDDRSSLVIRPFAPDAVIWDRSTPSSRAMRRTLGPACAPAGALLSSGLVTPGGAVSGAPTASATGCAAAGPGGGSCCSTSDGGVVLAPSPELNLM